MTLNDVVFAFAAIILLHLALHFFGMGRKTH